MIPFGNITSPVATGLVQPTTLLIENMAHRSVSG